MAAFPGPRGVRAPTEHQRQQQFMLEDAAREQRAYDSAVRQRQAGESYEYDELTMAKRLSAQKAPMVNCCTTGPVSVDTTATGPVDPVGVTGAIGPVGVTGAIGPGPIGAGPADSVQELTRAQKTHEAFLEFNRDTEMGVAATCRAPEKRVRVTESDYKLKTEERYEKI